MDIELKEEQLFWDLDAAVKKYEKSKQLDVTPISTKMEKLINGAEHCKEMIRTKGSISPEQFYASLNEFAYIYAWNDYDWISIINMAHDNKFAGEKTISTKMQAKVAKREGNGKDFSFYKEEISIDLRILYTEDTKLDNHDYTKAEIKKLLDEGKIFILEEVEGRPKGKNYFFETYHQFECVLDKNPETEFLSESSIYYPFILQYIKKQLTKERLKELYREHLQHVNIQFYDATQEYAKDSWKKVAEECTMQFMEKGYTRRLVQLNNPRKKNL